MHEFNFSLLEFNSILLINGSYYGNLCCGNNKNQASVKLSYIASFLKKNSYTARDVCPKIAIRADWPGEGGEGQRKEYAVIYMLYLSNTTYKKMLNVKKRIRSQ